MTKYDIIFGSVLSLATDKQAIENIGEAHNRMKTIELGLVSSSNENRQFNLEKLTGDEYNVLSENHSFFVNQFISVIHEKKTMISAGSFE